MAQQLQNPIAASLAASPNDGRSASNVYDRMNGSPDSSSFTQVSPTSVDPLKVPAPVEAKGYKTIYRVDGMEGAGK